MTRFNLKKALKIIVGVIIFFTLPSILLFGFAYFKYNEELPHGVAGKEADALAQNMLNTLNYQAYQNLDYISWTFKKRRHYQWHKSQETCDVFWKNYQVHLNFRKRTLSIALRNNIAVEGESGEQLIESAFQYFKNDVFWLTAPYQVFNKGITRKLVTTSQNKNALLVTYKSGDSYLWQFDDTGKPLNFKMWTSKLPINGIEASWNNWKTTKSDVQFPTFHKFLFFGMEITDITETK